MGEANRKRTLDLASVSPAAREALEQLTKRFTDEGRLIEVGWIGMRLACVDPAAPEDQLREMRMAFFAGAQHLFHSIMTVMDDDREPTEQDLARMDLIDKELRAFIQDFELRHLPTAGRA